MVTGVFQRTTLDAEFVVDFEPQYWSCLEAYVQVVILAGGLGTRLSEETVSIPKPMVSIGEDPIIVHLMRFFASFGHTKFLVALGYKGYVLKEFFANYALHNSDLRIDIFDKRIEVIENRGENWEVELIDTGQSTMTGGRILRLKDFLEEDFLLTYGDGLSDVDLDSLIRHHRKSQRLATVTAVRPPARFGSLEVENGVVKKFGEKIAQDAGLINGGFFAFPRKF